MADPFSPQLGGFPQSGSIDGGSNFGEPSSVPYGGDIEQSPEYKRWRYKPTIGLSGETEYRVPKSRRQMRMEQRFLLDQKLLIQNQREEQFRNAESSRIALGERRQMLEEARFSRDLAAETKKQEQEMRDSEDANRAMAEVIGGGIDEQGRPVAGLNPDSDDYLLKRNAILMKNKRALNDNVFRSTLSNLDKLYFDRIDFEQKTAFDEMNFKQQQEFARQRAEASLKKEETKAISPESQNKAIADYLKAGGSEDFVAVAKKADPVTSKPVVDVDRLIIETAKLKAEQSAAEREEKSPEAKRLAAQEEERKSQRSKINDSIIRLEDDLATAESNFGLLMPNSTEYKGLERKVKTLKQQIQNRRDQLDKLELREPPQTPLISPQGVVSTPTTPTLPPNPQTTGQRPSLGDIFGGR